MSTNPSKNSSQNSNSSKTEKKVLGFSIKYIIMAIVVIGIAIGIAFIFGQLSFGILETNASNAGHLYGIITSAVAFFFFASYMRRKMEIEEIRKFFLIYFAVYFALVLVILIPLLENITYLYSTIGNALILFSVYTLILFLLNPGILGISGHFKKIFAGGKQVRVIMVYLAIAMMQLFGFALLNYSINLQAGGTAFAFPGSGGSLFDFVYYSIITLTTIGYGDIHPLTPAAKFSAMTQAIISHIVTVLFLAILFVYISSAFGSTEED